MAKIWAGIDHQDPSIRRENITTPQITMNQRRSFDGHELRQFVSQIVPVFFILMAEIAHVQSVPDLWSQPVFYEKGDPIVPGCVYLGQVPDEIIQTTENLMRDQMHPG